MFPTSLNGIVTGFEGREDGPATGSGRRRDDGGCHRLCGPFSGHRVFISLPASHALMAVTESLEPEGGRGGINEQVLQNAHNSFALPGRRK